MRFAGRVFVTAIFLTGAALLGLSLAASAQAKQPASLTQDGVPNQAFLQRTNELIDWLVANSDYERPTRMPAIAFLPIETINYIYRTNLNSGYSENRTIFAIYVHGLTVLPENFKLGWHDDLLLHELVHHLQATSGRRFPCPLAAEREAYEIQAEFTRQTGIGTPPDPMFVKQLSCEYH